MEVSEEDDDDVNESSNVISFPSDASTQESSNINDANHITPVESFQEFASATATFDPISNNASNLCMDINDADLITPFESFQVFCKCNIHF